ncbi:MAG: hypothetical protein B7Z44_05755 [Caulobacter sp. 12-67-6]|nr:MAG: hypothetical protein B7Z44_05755 [Caulobacter sp. 12-67-6]
MIEKLSARTARRIALAAQGFGKARPAAPGRRHVLATIEMLGLLQIDSVNVVSRSHYLPLFSRLGDYPRALLEDVAWGPKPALVEYWGHEASLMPRDLHPLFRWRMADARAGVGVWKGVAKFLNSHPDFIAAALDEIRRRGPIAAGDLEIGVKWHSHFREVLSHDAVPGSAPGDLTNSSELPDLQAFKRRPVPGRSSLYLFH